MFVLILTLPFLFCFSLPFLLLPHPDTSHHVPRLLPFLSSPVTQNREWNQLCVRREMKAGLGAEWDPLTSYADGSGEVIELGGR